MKTFHHSFAVFNINSLLVSYNLCRNAGLFHFLAATANRLHGQKSPAGHYPILIPYLASSQSLHIEALPAPPSNINRTEQII